VKVEDIRMCTESCLKEKKEVGGGKEVRENNGRG
jgi:hypothetical protein